MAVRTGNPRQSHECKNREKVTKKKQTSEKQHRNDGREKSVKKEKTEGQEGNEVKLMRCRKYRGEDRARTFGFLRRSAVRLGRMLFCLGGDNTVSIPSKPSSSFLPPTKFILPAFLLAELPVTLSFLFSTPVIRC